MTRDLLARARLRACRKWPHLTYAIMSMVPVETPGLGTCCVDQHWRLYWDPDFLAKYEPDVAATIMAHEVAHLVLKHSKRSPRSCANVPQDRERWNIAADAAINDLLRTDGQSVWGELEGKIVFPEKINMERGLSAEAYYRGLLEQEQQAAEAAKQAAEKAAESEEGRDRDDGEGAGGSDGQDEQSRGQSDEDGGQSDQPVAAGEDASDQSADSPAEGNDGADGDAAGGSGEANGDGSRRDGGQGDGTVAAEEQPQLTPQQPGTSGSCSDGVPREWEAAAPSEDNAAEGDEQTPPGLLEHEIDQVIREVAEHAAKMCGKGAGGWERFVENVLRPKVDPRVVLRRYIRKATTLNAGAGDERTYRRPSRRPTVGGLIKPSAVQPVPRITVVVDTSGSMGQRELATALGWIDSILSGFRLRDGINVVCGDTEAHTVETIFDPSKVSLAGGGGTCMRPIVQAAIEQKQPPQLVVLVTDCCMSDRDFPSREQAARVPIVVCATAGSKMWLERVPKFLPVVNLWEAMEDVA